MMDVDVTYQSHSHRLLSHFVRSVARRVRAIVVQSKSLLGPEMPRIVPRRPKSFLRLVAVGADQFGRLRHSVRRGRQRQGPGRREQPLNFATEELAVGQRAYQEVLRDYRGRVCPNHPDALRVKRVVNRLAKAGH